MTGDSSEYFKGLESTVCFSAEPLDWSAGRKRFVPLIHCATRYVSTKHLSRVRHETAMMKGERARTLKKPSCSFLESGAFVSRSLSSCSNSVSVART